MLQCLVEFGGYRLKELVGKLVSIRSYDNSVFPKPLKMCDIVVQKVNLVDAFFSGVHYFAQKTNLMAFIILDLDLMHW
jgi:hypothetical protein